MSAGKLLSEVAAALASGAIKIVDLSAPLGPETPVIALPPSIGKNTPKVEVYPISNYDADGPYWAWNWLKLGEHTGTHFDAPVHWLSGKGLPNNTTDTIPVGNFVAPANVIDCSKEAAADPDFLLTADGVKAWEAEHGAIEPGSWVLMRSEWHRRNGSSETFLNTDERGPHTPGPSTDCIEYIVAQGAVGWGVETVGTDAGKAATLTPPFPAHTLMHKANRYGLASLCNLDQLPPKGALLFVAPLKIVNGTGSPVRALAFVPGN